MNLRDLSQMSVRYKFIAVVVGIISVYLCSFFLAKVHKLVANTPVIVAEMRNEIIKKHSETTPNAAIVNYFYDVKEVSSEPDKITYAITRIEDGLTWEISIAKVDIALSTTEKLSIIKCYPAIKSK